jgi:hypothetical protein
MKKVFLVKRITKVNYDEYDSCVIVADDEDDVNEIIENYIDYPGVDQGYADRGRHDRKITEISLEHRGIVCSSFNAG